MTEEGNQITPYRVFSYDTLVMAVGSLTNDFGTPGVKSHALALETPQDCGALPSTAGPMR